MNFNFNIKNSPRAPGQSIFELTTACDLDHTAYFRTWNACGRREATAAGHRSRGDW